MNALKKAESAKQGAVPSVADNPAVVEPGRDLAQELGLDPPGQVGAAASATTSHSATSAGGLQLELEPTTVPVAESQPNGAGQSRNSGSSYSKPSATTQTNRNTAKTVFTAKQPAKSNSRLPFYIVVGVCLLGGAGYGYYLWLQMQPPALRPPVMAAQAPGPAKAIQPVSPAPVTPASTINAAAEVKVGDNPDSTAPAVPNTNATTERIAGQVDLLPPKTSGTALADNAVQPRMSSSRTPGAGRDAASAIGGAQVESPGNLRIVRNANNTAVNPDVQAGYAALQAGDLDRASQAYDRALRSEPANRDALLGAATVLLRLNRADAAEAYFRQTLRLHPQDAYAAAQLAALSARSDPIGALSQVNSLIARESERPENGTASGALAFVQGNQLAGQERWPEAQQAYFNAHRADPANPDYCFNLAVSLDRMHEPRLARDFYAKAIELAKSRSAGFDLSQAQKRLNQINSASK